MDQNKDQKMGVNWKFLTTLLDLWETMAERQDSYLISLSRTTTNPKIAYAEFASAIYNFFISVEGQFAPYLKEGNKKIKSTHYMLLRTKLNVNIKKTSTDIDEIFMLCRELNLWATTTGVFKTLTDNTQPKSFEEAIADE